MHKQNNDVTEHIIIFCLKKKEAKDNDWCEVKSSNARYG
jgi:hypothetical protein